MSKPVIAVITSMIAATLSGLGVLVYVEGSTRGARDQCLAELSAGKGEATALRAEATALRTEKDRLNVSLASLNNQRDALAAEFAQRAGEIETLTTERAQQAREIETLVAKAKSVVTDREPTIAREDPPGADLAHGGTTSDELEQQAAEKVISEYLAANTPDERLKHCHLGSLTPTQFYRFYADRKYGFNPLRVTKLAFKDRLTYQVEAIRNDGMVLSARYYLTSTVDRVLIDWPRSVGLNDPTINVFQARREQQPKGFWVKAELTEYYNFEFKDSQLYQSAGLEEETPDGVEMYHGYLRRSDSTCNAFIEYLSRGEQPMSVLLEPDHGLHGHFLILKWTPGFVEGDGITQRR